MTPGDKAAWRTAARVGIAFGVAWAICLIGAIASGETHDPLAFDAFVIVADAMALLADACILAWALWETVLS